MNFHMKWLNVFKLFSKIGLSSHDLLILMMILETCWWSMFSFVDGADALLSFVEPDAIEETDHDYMIVQKCVSLFRLVVMSFPLWYGTISWGKPLALRIYVYLGIITDLVLILTLAVIAFEEKWFFAVANLLVGTQYLLVLTTIRTFVYIVMLHCMMDIFGSTFESPSIGTVNGRIVGLPEQIGQSGNCGSGKNLMFLGKGFKALLDYYRDEAERAFLICLVWDVIWNLTILITQELPELVYTNLFIGLFGSLSVLLPTELVSFRCARVCMSLIAIYFVKRRHTKALKIWIAASFLLMAVNTGVFCYIASTGTVYDSSVAIIILCLTFLVSNLVKLVIMYCAIRFYIFLQRGDLPLIDENENDY